MAELRLFRRDTYVHPSTPLLCQKEPEGETYVLEVSGTGTPSLRYLPPPASEDIFKTIRHMRYALQSLDINSLKNSNEKNLLQFVLFHLHDLERDCRSILGGRSEGA